MRQGPSPLVRGILASLAGILLALLFDLSGVLPGTDRLFYDIGARFGASLEEPSPDAADGSAGVRLIYIDQYSLEWARKALGVVWPWPRELYGIMAEFCVDAKAQVFDMLFTEASPYGVWDDERMATAFKKAGNVVAAVAGGGVAAAGGGVAAAMPELSLRFGDARGLPDSDGVIRRYGIPAEPGLPGTLVGGRVPSLATAALIESGYLQAAPEVASPYIRYYGSSPSFPAWNAASVLAAALGLPAEGPNSPAPETFANAYVFVGFSAPGLLDRQATPADPAMPGAEIHATYLWNVLTGRLPRAAAPAMVWAIAILAAMGAAAAAVYVRKAAALAATYVTIVFLPPLAGVAAYQAGLVVPVSAIMASGLGSLTMGLVLAYVAEGRNRAFLKRGFGQYLAPSVVEEIVKNPSLLELGGTEREITVFFSDIEGFTTLSETMTPSRLASFMNEYFAVISTVILEEGGTIDKYVGDAVVAFWNAPLDQPDHALRALRAAIRCQAAFKAACSRFEALGVSIPRTRIGVHSGRAIVGNMGSPERFNYTALGDVVNTASRLEAANKILGTSILTSKATVDMVPGTKTEGSGVSAQGLWLRRLGQIAVAGKRSSIEVWEPVDLGNPGSPCEPWEGCRDCQA